MNEAILTIIVPATEDEPAHTRVYRFEYQGSDVVSATTDTAVITLHLLASAEQLKGDGEL